MITGKDHADCGNALEAGWLGKGETTVLVSKQTNQEVWGRGALVRARVSLQFRLKSTT